MKTAEEDVRWRDKSSLSQIAIVSTFDLHKYIKVKNMNYVNRHLFLFLNTTQSYKIK